MASKVVSFGEIMLRLAPPGCQRLQSARSFDAVYGGGEANVAVSLANFGVPADFVTRLPDNDIGEACLRFVRQYGVGTAKIIRGGGRLGIYYLETGSMHRGSKVVYDRAHSAIAEIEPGMIDWRAAFADADWFHWTGITPAISEGASATCLEAAKTAREMGLTVSCDLNFRKNLWKWGKTASEVMPELVAMCDVAIGNEEDAEKVFGIKAPGVDVVAGKIDAGAYQAVCDELIARNPQLRTIGITLRGSISADHNTWSGVLYRGGKMYTARKYDLTDIVDRVGGGDAFAAGLIYGLKTYGDDCQKVIEFATAASCLKHTIEGDFNSVSADEVEKLMGGDASGRVSR